MNETEQLIDLLFDTVFMDYKETAKFLIANGVTVQKWIPVSERLPEKYKEVLVHRLTGCEVTCCIDTKNRKWFGDEICCYDVTHWMPLPEPPKGE